MKKAEMKALNIVGTCDCCECGGTMQIKLAAGKNPELPCTAQCTDQECKSWFDCRMPI